MTAPHLLPRVREFVLCPVCRQEVERSQIICYPSGKTKICRACQYKRQQASHAKRRDAGNSERCQECGHWKTTGELCNNCKRRQKRHSVQVFPTWATGGYAISAPGDVWR